MFGKGDIRGSSIKYPILDSLYEAEIRSMIALGNEGHGGELREFSIALGTEASIVSGHLQGCTLQPVSTPFSQRK